MTILRHTRQARVAAYDPRAYDRLNTFRVAKTLLAENEHHIPGLGKVFLRHNLQERFGLTLLHKHFDIGSDEIVFRTINARRRVARMGPANRQKLAVSYLWKASARNRGTWRFFPLEFLGAGTAESSKSSAMPATAPFLGELAETLAELGLLDVFGVSTTNMRSLPVADDELLVETTDPKRRLLTLKPERLSDVNIDELTQTNWTFTPEEGFIDRAAATAACKGQHCASHCTSHCTGTHCTGHCKNHAPKEQDPDDRGGDV